jgi:hypothetical protein
MAFLRLPEVCTSMNRKDSILALLVNSFGQHWFARLKQPAV